MKKAAALLCLIALLAALGCPALASVRATPNQKLALRSGPSTAYSEIGTMPQSTAIRAFEYEMGNDVIWVLVEYTWEGQVSRGYTGLKRMSVEGSIPWAHHLNQDARIGRGGTVLAAPTERALYRGSVAAGDWVLLLGYEGDYAYIEYYDFDAQVQVRGYVPSDMLSSTWLPGGGTIQPPSANDAQPSRRGVSATPNQSLGLRTGPNTEYAWLDTRPQNTAITAYEYESGNGVTWVLVEYRIDGLRCRGYTGLKRMTVNGSIPWADHLNCYAKALCDTCVYAAPGWDACDRGELIRTQGVTLLGFEDGFAYIEFYDFAIGELSRGYVPEETLEY